MSTTFPVTFPGDKVYQIGGRPLCSDAKLVKVFPELSKSIKDNELKDYPEDHEMSGEEADEMMEKMEGQILGIVKHFNEGVDSDSFLTDSYSYGEALKVWNGQAELDGKKKTVETP